MFLIQIKKEESLYMTAEYILRKETYKARTQEKSRQSAINEQFWDAKDELGFGLLQGNLLSQLQIRRKLVFGNWNPFRLTLLCVLIVMCPYCYVTYFTNKNYVRRKKDLNVLEMR